MCDFNLGRPTSGSDARTLDLYGVGDSFEVTVDSPNRAIALSRQPTLTSTPSRVLVCRPNGRLGNTLLLTPLLQELERVFPGAEIDQDRRPIRSREGHGLPIGRDGGWFAGHRCRGDPACLLSRGHVPQPQRPVAIEAE